MKQLLHLGAAILFAATATTALHGQTLPDLSVSASGYSGQRLFNSTPGYTITGLAADAAGDVFYIETDSTNYSANTMLYMRTASDGYATPTPLFDYGAFRYGSFVTVQSGKVYFGESSANTIRSVNLNGSSPALIGTVTGNYDLAFSGGSAFVSANPDTTFSNPQNKVFTLNLATGATQAVLDATPDYSGPLEFDAFGNLIYGVAKSSIGGLYQYSAASVAMAISTSTPLTLSPPTGRAVANGGNQYLAYAGGTSLWQDDFATLRLYDLGAASGIDIASTTFTFGNLDYAGGELFTGITDFANSRSSVFVVVPEPASACLFFAGLAVLPRRRR